MIEMMLQDWLRKNKDLFIYLFIIYIYEIFKTEMTSRACHDHYTFPESSFLNPNLVLDPDLIWVCGPGSGTWKAKMTPK